MKIYNLLFRILILILLFSSCTTHRYYFVRHADRDGTLDRLKEPEGLTRAKELGNLLRNKGIRNVFATNTQRARQTATPLSEYTGVPVTAYTTKAPELAALLKTSSNSLVVGHSNTVPAIVREMGVNPAMDEIPHEVYDKLFIVKRRKLLWGSWKATLEITRYGAPTPL